MELSPPPQKKMMMSTPSARLKRNESEANSASNSARAQEKEGGPSANEIQDGDNAKEKEGGPSAIERQDGPTATEEDEEVPELLDPPNPIMTSTGLQSQISQNVISTRVTRLRPLHTAFIKKEEKRTLTSSPTRKKGCRPPMRLASSDEEVEQIPKGESKNSNPRKLKRLTSGATI